MFPPSLQKNIKELDRQISLLESECENMECDRKEFQSHNLISVKQTPKEPFITGPVFNSSSFFRKTSSVVPRLYSPNYSFAKLGKMPSTGMDSLASCDLKKIEDRNRMIREKEIRDQISKRSTNSITEISESSCENHKLKNISSRNHVKGPTWSDIFYRQTLSSREMDRKSKTPKEKPKSQSARRKSDSDKYLKLLSPDKSSSEEEPTKELISNEIEDRISNHNERPLSSDRNSMKKRRRRSTRTRRNSIDELPVDVNLNKLWNEKEIQCMLWNEEKEKAQFLVNLHDSIRTLHLLIGDLRTKPCVSVGAAQRNISEVYGDRGLAFRTVKKWFGRFRLGDFNLEDHSGTPFNIENDILCALVKENPKLLGGPETQEKNDEVLNDMQNTLLKITGIKSMNALNDPLSLFANLKGENLKLIEGEEMEVAQFKKALLGAKKFCEELSGEKSTLSEELAQKNQTIATMKNKEKEYLSLISSLKFNLEKIKQDADEGSRIKKSLLLVKNKLQEEIKVVEALKKSHGKMQRIVENYVLENDKLRTQLKIAELESQKFNVLLTGREEEVKKYKEEIESFQKHISQQLNVLRSKAAMEAIKAVDNETNIFSKSESYLIESCLKDKSQSQPFSPEVFAELKNEINGKTGTSAQESSGPLGVLENDKAGTKKDIHYPLTTQSSCKQLKSNIEGILEDMKIQCRSCLNSSRASQRTPPSTSSEEV